MKNFIRRVVTGCVLGLCFWFSFIFFAPMVFSLILFAILVAIITCEWVNFFDISTPLFWVTMPFYPILPFVLLIIMNHNPLYHNLLLYLFILVSSHDTGSYIVGSMIGRHKILPAISPGKSWEGFLGGLVFATIGFRFLLTEMKIGKTWFFTITFSLIVCLLALAGDLFESYLKRRVRIKDSGNLLPGHGGFLDRFDGILFAVFFFYIFKDELVKIFK